MNIIREIIALIASDYEGPKASWDMDNGEWNVGDVIVKPTEDGKFLVDDKEVEDKDLAKLLKFRFEFDQGVCRAVDDLVDRSR